MKYMVFSNGMVSVRPWFYTFAVISLSALGLTALATQSQQTGPSPLGPADREVLAKNFVKERLQVWQKRLNLEKWKIDVRLVRHASLKPQTLGNIHWDYATMLATIDVQSSYDYKLSFPEMLDDMEFTVVHELIHLELSSLPRSEASRSAEEHAVNEITQAFLNLAKKR